MIITPATPHAVRPPVRATRRGEAWGRAVANKGMRAVFLSLFMAIAASARPEVIVEHYGVDDGLPSNTVYASLKDSDGFLWFGTWHGLCSFDGVRFTPHVTRFRKDSDIPPGKVASFVQDKAGYIWLRDVDNHLYLFSPEAERFHYVYEELRRKSGNVQVIKVDNMPNGHVLLLTRDKSMYEAWVEEGDVELSRLLNGEGHTDRSTLSLRHNVLGETDTRLFWIDRKFTMYVEEKTPGRRILASIPAGTEFTCCSRAGRHLCVGTASGEVYMIDVHAGSVRRYALKRGRAAVTGAIPLGGKIYVATSAGFCSLTEDGVTTELSGRLAGASSPFADSTGKLWMNKGRKEIVCYDPASGKVSSWTMSLDSIQSLVTYQDAGMNGLFILTLNGDVWHYDHKAGSMEGVTSMEGFPAGTEGGRQHFLGLYLDNGGTLWLASASDGVYKISFPPRNFTFLFPGLLSPSGSNGGDNGVRAVFQSRDGSLWIGTRGGELYCVDAISGEVKRRYGGETGSVYHIMEDSRGNLWLSTKGEGLIKAVPDNGSPQGFAMKRYRSDGGMYSINSDRVYYTFEDSRNHIWVCTFGGGLNLVEEHGGEVLFHNKDNSFGDYPQYDLYTKTRVMTEDGNGRLWVGTTDGLMSLEGNFGNVGEIDFETYRGGDNVTVADNDILALCKDSRGGIWMGTFGGGLRKIESYDAAEHSPVVRGYSLPGYREGNVVTSIVEDDRHCLWVGTERGLWSLELDSLRAERYDRFAGFPVVHIEDNTSLLAAGGKVLIGCREGLLAFNPTEVRSGDRQEYKTYLADIRVLNKGLYEFDPPIYEGSPRYAKEIVLGHEQNMFTIEFGTLTYKDPGRTSYTYILEGYEERWHDNGSNRYASYANVPPGKYTLRVKPADGVSPECVLSVTVTPPWWATWWARAIYFIVGCAALCGVIWLIRYIIRMRNDMYVNDRLAELKIRFFTNVSHELRTPLTLIKGPVEELKKKERLSETGKQYLALIDKNAGKMLRLVNQILDFRKVQSGKMRLRVSLVDIKAMLRAFADEYRVMAEERKIAFRVELPDEKVTAWCDAGKIKVVADNLVNNAFKFTPQEGVICISLENMPEERRCRIRVEDDGPSIPAGQQERIFERFAQADGKGSPVGGTGIGLSLSREFVNMHGGKIWVENVSHESGVAFIVELPTDKEHFTGSYDLCMDDTSAEEVAADTRGTASGGGSENLEGAGQEGAGDGQMPVILLVDDNEDLCHMVRLQLSPSFNVITACDGEDGLRKIYRYRPDIIITDLMMPGMDGMELLRRVRSDFNISHTPVIMLTARHGDESMTAAVAGGANAYVTKPFSGGYLLARINQLIEEQRIFQRKMALHNWDRRAEGTGGKDAYERHLVERDMLFIEKIHEIIEANLNTADFNINKIAETIGLSRSAFFKKLKSLTGLAPVDLVRDIRLSKAAAMLEGTDENITSVAYAVGFHDVGYFGKCFRHKFGKTPKEYRAASVAEGHGKPA